MDERQTAYIGIGASLGSRETAVLRAAREIESSRAGNLIRLSSLYETVPVGMDSDAPFINAVAAVETLLSSDDLLERLKTIEKRMGRLGGHMRPREIDLDLIAYGNTDAETVDLTLPHPRYGGRAFVLVPLADVAPQFVCSKTGFGITEMLSAVDTTGVERISSRKFVGRLRRDN